MELIKKKINTERMQEVLDCFAEITGIRAAFFENFIKCKFIFRSYNFFKII